MVAADVCYRHAGLAPTPAQREAPRRNAVKHGYFSKSLSAEDVERLLRYYDGIREDKFDAQRAYAAYAMVLSERVTAWDAGQEQPSPLTILAAQAVGRALDRVRPLEDAGKEDFDPQQLGRIVDVLAANPEVFLKRLKPEAQEEVRAVLRKWGVEA